MTGLADTLIQGVLLGGLYALFAAGLSLTFGIMRLVNLAHGDLIVLAAFAILALASWLALDPFLAVLVALPLMFAPAHPSQPHARPRLAAAIAGNVWAFDHHPERPDAGLHR